MQRVRSRWHASILRRRPRASPAALFGGRVREQIPILWVLATGDANKDIAEAQQKLEQRLHNLFLVKIGHGDPLTDVARAVVVKRALGDHASVRVDVNQSWDEATATLAIAELEAGGIDVVEQPLPGANIEGMRRLTERFATPIMADEPIETVEDALAFVRANAADAFSRRLSKHGGLNNTQKFQQLPGGPSLPLRRDDAGKRHWHCGIRATLPHFRPCDGAASYSGRCCSRMTLLPLGLFTVTFSSSCRRGPGSALRSMKKN